MKDFHKPRRRMKPYLATKDTGQAKFYPELSDGKLGISKLGKLVAKNANRSRKKATRQEAKNFIKQTQLDE